MKIYENKKFSNIRKLSGFSNKTIYLAITFVLIFAATAAALGEPVCSPTVMLLNQDPYPGTPDSYVKLVFMVGGVSGANCAKGAWVKLVPSYPFSLDGDTPLKELEGNTFIPNQNSNWMVPYKLRVSRDALGGDYNIEVQYGAKGILPSGSGSYAVKMFNITLQDSRTSFDALIQEVNGQDVTIALANSGKNAANSVVVRIPEQDDFRPVGTDGQMVGNLASGDYTVVAFSLAPKGTMNRQNLTRQDFQQMQAESIKNLELDIYYTDSLGERRIIKTELPLDLRGAMNMTGFGGTFAARRGEVQASTFSLSSLLSWQVLAALFIGAAITFAAARKAYKGRKHHAAPNEVPDWAKEKKK